MEIKDLPTEVLVAAKEKYIDILKRGRDGYHFNDWNSNTCSICQYMKEFTRSEYNYCGACPLVQDKWCNDGRGSVSRLHHSNINWESDVKKFIGLLSKEIKSREFVDISVGCETFRVHKKKAYRIKNLILEEIAKK